MVGRNILHLILHRPGFILGKLFLLLVTASAIISLRHATANAQAGDPSLRDFFVKYLSAEYIYLDGGKSDGLRKGDRLMITRGDTLVAMLEIRYLSNASASCVIVDGAGKVFPKDAAILAQRGPADVSAPGGTAQKDTISINAQTNDPSEADAKRPRPPTRVTGTVSTQVYSWNDNNRDYLDFTQTTLRLNLRIRQIAGRALHLAIRTRGEYDNRTSLSVARKDEWSNRVHEFSLAFDDAESPFNFQFGRILPRRLSGAGYIDGLLLERRLSESSRLGAFAGMKPRWQYQDNLSSMQKYGAYFTLSRGSYKTSLFEQTVALTGEYHGMTSSRELIYFQGQLSIASRWYLSHITELDYNRSWRKEKEGNTLSLTNLYLTTRYRANKNVTLGISYDNRRNYWNYETRSLADSLFDDQLRTGVRGQISLRLPSQISFNANSGYRKRSDDPDATVSYSFSLSKYGLGFSGSNLNLRYAGFSGPLNDGSNYGVQLSHYFRSGTSIFIGYSEYQYSYSTSGGTRMNRSWEAGLNLNFLKHLFLIASSRFEKGDDSRGTGLRGEIGYRL